ncbi:MAG: GNAT family N-acetyltransferase [Nocardioidaceae bacterium]|nr:GNAT family N-acetyltransferase [Nocardioidaceae bacterium]
MTSGINIRPAAADEAALLTALALRSKAHGGYDEAFIAACRDELTLKDGELAARRTRVAEASGQALGFSTLEGTAPTGVLGMLFVEPDLIGQGVGGLLMRDLLARARDLGFTTLSIDADPGAEPFYLAHGAVRLGATPSGSIPGRMLPLLELRLA